MMLCMLKMVPLKFLREHVYDYYTYGSKTDLKCNSKMTYIAECNKYAGLVSLNIYGDSYVQS